MIGMSTLYVGLIVLILLAASIMLRRAFPLS